MLSKRQRTRAPYTCSVENMSVSFQIRDLSSSVSHWTLNEQRSGRRIVVFSKDKEGILAVTPTTDKIAEDMLDVQSYVAVSCIYLYSDGSYTISVHDVLKLFQFVTGITLGNEDTARARSALANDSIKRGPNAIPIRRCTVEEAKYPHIYNQLISYRNPKPYSKLPSQKTFVLYKWDDLPKALSSVKKGQKNGASSRAWRAPPTPIFTRRPRDHVRPGHSSRSSEGSITYPSLPDSRPIDSTMGGVVLAPLNLTSPWTKVVLPSIRDVITSIENDFVTANTGGKVMRTRRNKSLSGVFMQG